MKAADFSCFWVSVAHGTERQQLKGRRGIYPGSPPAVLACTVINRRLFCCVLFLYSVVAVAAVPLQKHRESARRSATRFSGPASIQTPPFTHTHRHTTRYTPDSLLDSNTQPSNISQCVSVV